MSKTEYISSYGFLYFLNFGPFNLISHLFVSDKPLHFYYTLHICNITMYQEIIALSDQNSLRKKPRLSISEVAFQTQKTKITKQSFKPELKRKFSQINLKDVLLTGLNCENPTINLKINHNADPEQQNLFKPVKRSRSNSNHLHESKNQNFIVKFIENQGITNSLRPKNKSRQNVSSDSFLPSIFKNSIFQSKSSSVKLEAGSETNRTEEQKGFVSLELQSLLPKTKQASIAFKKLRSQSLIHLQNKLKLQRAKLSSRNESKQQQHSQQKQFDLPRSNTQKVQPTFSKETSPQNKKKKFFINNLSLQTPENHAEGLQKRNYILKFLEKHEKQLLPKPQNRKNTYFNVEKEKTGEKLNSKNFYSEENLISRKIVFAHPDEILLKKVESGLVKPGKDKGNVNYNSQTSKNSKMKQKTKKQCINGWDFQHEHQQLFEVDEKEFQSAL